ncbi:hypothetical protein WA026_020697 [Henosepilachna vigintioctopunctata]|uniref:CD80-like immunoglobulin C2-set domain-containing protein n=1 Tax=Henosepilachna vigintioctopunctata TaxID=420089 RepID=A0AAW1UAH1_9CUCU
MLSYYLHTLIAFHSYHIVRKTQLDQRSQLDGKNLLRSLESFQLDEYKQEAIFREMESVRRMIQPKDHQNVYYSGNWFVSALPKEDPTITGVETQYEIGDDINLNCTSGRSYPASILNWYINEQKVVSPSTLIRYPHTHHKHGLISVTLGLKFTLSSRHFLGGSMRVKCTASVSPELWRGDRESIVQSMDVKDMREALLLVKSFSTVVTPYPLALFVSFLLFSVVM